MKLKSIKVNNVEIIGRWYHEDTYNAWSEKLYKKNDTIYMLTNYRGGYANTTTLITYDLIRFDNVADDLNDEYYRIESNGNLGVYDLIEDTKALEFIKY